MGRREGPQMTPSFGMGYSGCLRCATCRTEVGTRQVGKEVRYTDLKLRRERAMRLYPAEARGTGMYLGRQMWNEERTGQRIEP